MEWLRNLLHEIGAGWAVEWPKALNVPLNSWINDFVEWLITEHGQAFEAVSNSISVVLLAIEQTLRGMPWLVMFFFITALAWFISGRRLGMTILVAVCLFSIGLIDPQLWDNAMVTLSVMLVATILCIVIGIPVGLLISAQDRLRSLVIPLLDLMQTMPSFVYLIPAIMLFGLGAVPAIFATVIYAIPPVIRLTDLGIRLVDSGLGEACDAMGANRIQKLLGLQIPTALPNILQGINQTTMLALSMVVIASMIGTRGLGTEVLLGLQQLNVGRALEAGIAIVLLAIVMDRITQAYGRKLLRAQRGR
ncbi:MAG: proline/glycine betaine ABC transporter permease [Cyanobacteria bacterium MAG CAR3_bin_5]|nr:proline/glycine betaine ABC transporter permease [Cyanobacteria bacterium MAG CAR3_bin_5]MCY4331230.1 proline/glycine betaine ABC transporter permease [Cyanobacteria bacterium MAG CAR1_bin_15]